VKANAVLKNSPPWQLQKMIVKIVVERNAEASFEIFQEAGGVNRGKKL